jgi:hypothetical protein
MDDGAKPIADESERKAVRTQASKVHARALAAAAALTAAALLLPD